MAELFDAVDINGMVLPNRIVLTAMVTRLSGEDGYVNQDITDRYVRYAEGEPGLIIVEAMAVHSSKSGPLLRLSDDEFMPGHTEMLKKMRDVSPSKVVPQIIHFLKISRRDWRQKVTDLSKEDIESIIEDYGSAAVRAREAGYDGVELHMAHAYTLSSFLSARNNRKDEFGGSLENRLRVPTLAIQKVRERVGDDFPVGLRFDGEECIINGYGLEESKEMALRFARLGIDYISVSAGGKFEDAVPKEGEPLYPYTGYSGERCMPGMTYPDGANIYLPAGIKQHINAHGFDTPVVGTGKIRTAEYAQQVLDEGQADLVGMARTLLADPDWPKKVREGNAAKVVTCISINVCKQLDGAFKKVRCYLWDKQDLHAPSSDDKIPPHWVNGTANLTAEYRDGKVRLTWEDADDNEELYGYEILRSDDGGDFNLVYALRANMKTHFADSSAVAGSKYIYRVRAYDVAGNRSEPSNDAELEIPLPVG